MYRAIARHSVQHDRLSRTFLPPDQDAAIISARNARPRRALTRRLVSWNPAASKRASHPIRSGDIPNTGPRGCDTALWRSAAVSRLLVDAGSLLTGQAFDGRKGTGCVLGTKGV